MSIYIPPTRGQLEKLRSHNAELRSRIAEIERQRDRLLEELRSWLADVTPAHATLDAAEVTGQATPLLPNPFVPEYIFPRTRVPAGPSEVPSRYPHTCERCGGPCYIGFSTVDHPGECR